MPSAIAWSASACLERSSLCCRAPVVIIGRCVSPGQPNLVTRFRTSEQTMSPPHPSPRRYSGSIRPALGRHYQNDGAVVRHLPARPVASVAGGDPSSTAIATVDSGRHRLRTSPGSGGRANSRRRPARVVDPVGDLLETCLGDRGHGRPLTLSDLPSSADRAVRRSRSDVVPR